MFGENPTIPHKVIVGKISFTFCAKSLQPKSLNTYDLPDSSLSYL